jgi:hypothetical protein
MTTDLFAATIVFQDPLGNSHEQVVFGDDITKLVRSMTNYAMYLSLASFAVRGSMVENMDQYWEGTTGNLKEVPDELTVH